MVNTGTFGPFLLDLLLSNLLRLSDNKAFELLSLFVGTFFFVSKIFFDLEKKAYFKDPHEILLIQELTTIILEDEDDPGLWKWHMTMQQLIFTIIASFNLNVNDTTYLMESEFTMLSFACQLSIPVVVETLLSLDAKASLPSPADGRTAFSMGTGRINSEEIIAMLIETDEDMNEKDVEFLKEFRDEAISTIYQVEHGIRITDVSGSDSGFKTLEEAKLVKKQVKQLLKYHKRT